MARFLHFVVLVCTLVVLGHNHGAAAFQSSPAPAFTADELPYEKFVSDYVKTRTPVVIKGFMNEALKEVFNTKGGALEFLKRKCGDELIRKDCTDENGKLVEDYHKVRQLDPALLGSQWGSLAETDIDELNIKTIADLIQVQQSRKGTDAPLPYLHDASIASHCPALLDTFTIPKWFPFDYLTWTYNRQTWGAMCDRTLPEPVNGKPIFPQHKTPPEQGHTHQWPSLFIGPDGTVSSVHTDAFGTHFWMVVVEGTKYWKLFPVEEGPKLYPTQHIKSLHSPEYDTWKKFKVDVFNPDYEKYPDAKDAKVWEYNLTAGDVLFIPAGLPHGVKNIGDTVAYSFNLVEPANFDFHMKVNLAEAEGWPMYSEGQMELFNFMTNVADLPLPTKDFETLGEYYERQHPLNVIKIGNNREKWHKFTGMREPFEEWLNGTTVGPTSLCVDTQPECEDWMQDGECMSNAWMLRNCRRACGTCSVPADAIPDPLVGKEWTVCRDVFTKCSQWMASGECERNPKWMNENCPRSCLACHQKAQGCKDYNPSCQGWAKQGDCYRNSQWMRLHCCKSCHTDNVQADSDSVY